MGSDYLGVKVPSPRTLQHLGDRPWIELLASEKLSYRGPVAGALYHLGIWGPCMGEEEARTESPFA